jgi:hypothetical protein
MQLCSAGFAGGFSVTAFHARFTVLRVSRHRGACASPLHLGERNSTSTVPKLSKTSLVSAPHPWRVAISRERIAASPCTRLSRAPSTMTPPTPIRFIAGRLSSPHGPPTFMVMDSARVCRWCLMGNPSRALRYPDRTGGNSGNLCQPLSWPAPSSFGHPSEANVPLDAVATPSILGSEAQAMPDIPW